jgi:hypothetical protein
MAFLSLWHFLTKQTIGSVMLADGSSYEIDWQWSNSVQSENSKFEISSCNIEIIHRKGSGAIWGTLQAAQTVASVPVVGRHNVVTDGATKPSYPTSSKTKRDWDELNIAAKKEEKEDNKDGPAALHSLFQGIYKDGDEDSRRAMVKSYQTSGGTVLSTNWKEVAKKDYEKELEAPKGQEFRKWNE